MVAKKKTETIKKEKEVKKKPEPQKINLDHDFSFNLLTEPWLPVVSIKGEKKFLSLNDFLKQAHDLERFDFPLPGLETAVLRFLVAIVHIVGAPNDKSEWEDWYKRGKFEDTFITELQKYKDKLDLFSKTDPFLQEVEFYDNTIKPVSKLIDSFPSGNNSSHFGILDLKKGFDSICLHPSIAFPIMLYCFVGVLAGTDGDGGLNGGSTPYYVSIHSNNIFKTIFLNVIDASQINELAYKRKCKKAQSGWLENIKDDTSTSNLSIQDSLLWKPRKIRLIPVKIENKLCSVTGKTITEFGIKEISYTKQKATLKKGEFWEDSFNAIVEAPISKSKTELKKSKPFGDLPSWKDFPNLILLEKKQDLDKQQDLAKFINPPLLVRRLLEITAKKEKTISICVLGVITNKAKILRISENKFPFKPSFVEDESISSKIKLIVQDTKKFEGKILFSLVLSLKLEKKIKTKQGRKIRERILLIFQSAYWHELGAMFEDSLARLAESDKYASDVLIDWKKMLAKHVRSTFERHTQKLIHNPKNLKAYENGRRYIEIGIYSQLTKEQT